MERWKTIGAIAFVVFALFILLGSMNNTAVKNLAGAGLISIENAKPAADFTLPIVGAGKSVSLLSEAKRSPVVFSFWATWCGPCRMELPHLEALSKKYAGKVAFYGVNSNDPTDKINEFTKTNALSLPMLLDANREAATKYGVDAIPLLVVVDTHGKVRAVNEGFDTDIDTNLPAVLDAILKGK